MKRWWIWLFASAMATVLGLYAFAWTLPGDDELERVALMASSVGPLIVVASTIFVVVQIREAANAARAQLFDATAGRMLDMTRIFVELPELRPFFYDGKRPEEVPEFRDRVYAVAEMHLDFFDSELLRKRVFGRSLRDLPSFDGWIIDMLASSPAMCQLLKEDEARKKRWYDEIHQRHFSARLSGSHTSRRT